MSHAPSRSPGWAVAVAIAAGAGGACVSSRPIPAPAPMATPSPARSRPAVADDPDVVDDLVAAHNAERARRGLEPLRLNPALADAAAGHARDMAGRRKMSHTGGDRSSPFDRIGRSGYRYNRAGENVAAGQTEVAEVMGDWMHSPGHRRNILGAYREIGVARAIGADGTAYWCATFGQAASR